MQCQNKINLGEGSVPCDHSALPGSNPPICGCCELIEPYLNDLRAAVDHVITHAVQRGADPNLFRPLAGVNN